MSEEVDREVRSVLVSIFIILGVVVFMSGLIFFVGYQTAYNDRFCIAYCGNEAAKLSGNICLCPQRDGGVR